MFFFCSGGFIISQHPHLLVLSLVTLFFFLLWCLCLEALTRSSTTFCREWDLITRYFVYIYISNNKHYMFIIRWQKHSTYMSCLSSSSVLFFLISLFLSASLHPFPFPTVFLSVSCLESQPAGQPRARKFVSGSTVKREATCSGGSAASALAWGLFLTVDPQLLFQARPLERDYQPGNMRGVRLSLWDQYLMKTFCITRWEFSLLYILIHSKHQCRHIQAKTHLYWMNFCTSLCSNLIEMLDEESVDN